MSLDSEKLIPNRAQRNWLIAQAHVAEIEEYDKILEKKDGVTPDVDYIGGQEFYDEAISKIKNQIPTPYNLADQFISEKALNIDKVRYAINLKFHSSIKRRFLRVSKSNS